MSEKLNNTRENIARENVASDWDDVGIDNGNALFGQSDVANKKEVTQDKNVAEISENDGFVAGEAREKILDHLNPQFLEEFVEYETKMLLDGVEMMSILAKNGSGDIDGLSVMVASPEFFRVLDAGTSPLDALKAGLLYDIRYNETTGLEEPVGYTDEYVSDTIESVPVLAGYFGDAPSKEQKMMKEIIEQRLNDNYILTPEQRAFLEQHDDVIAERILHDKRDFSAERVQRIVNGVDVFRWSNEAWVDVDGAPMSAEEAKADEEIWYVNGELLPVADELALWEKQKDPRAVAGAQVLRQHLKEIVCDPETAEVLRRIAGLKLGTSEYAREVLTEFGDKAEVAAE